MSTRRPRIRVGVSTGGPRIRAGGSTRRPRIWAGVSTGGPRIRDSGSTRDQE